MHFDMIAIISDIHSNIEALQEVLKDIENRGISKIICLGDVVGYGPNPSECVERARNFELTILGNHDEGVLGSAVGFTSVARQALDWTRTELKPNWFSSQKKKANWKFLEKLPIKHEIDNILYVHGSPRQPTTEYILRSDCDQILGEPSAKITEIFGMLKHLCFVGHTHDPGIIADNEYKFLVPDEINNTYEVKESIKLIVNVGSVGQPRDGDPRACYITFDGKTINYYRVAYDYNSTKEKIFQITQIDRRFGERLPAGR